MIAARTLLPIGGAALALALAFTPAAATDQSGGLLPVPAVTINRGEVVSPEMLTEKHFYFDPNRPLAVLTDPSLALGRQARRTLRAGKPIPLNAFQSAKLVFRGTPTEARFRMGNLTITTTVLPQDDGGAGDIVRARNLDSNRIISGVVGMDGAIEVSAP
ncbi:flagellar basal body P-ring formation chaperone FlgA [Acuticoccus sp. I52.16.1]|uniref:flagellar basal body P-ring formation chaperone FlgA n=1 Tax=Acuticoccus sp. I52.16.1 TaxID=2928472 RepID=UPI001FD1DF59|nr:flagellar basal body P-ring formation chaperone FlgA [Acuticoccus sp. I52.16.1]UOM34304.1 flagellar basal body P-ring formation chaperone FlgA [Acuticoccus sp. I52.16.1]